MRRFLRADCARLRFVLRLQIEECEQMSDDPNWTTANKKAIEQKKKAAALIFSLRKVWFLPFLLVFLAKQLFL